MSVAVPLVLCIVNVPLVSTVKTTRPTYSVVEGPAGTSVGNRIKTLCPVTSHVCDPSAFSVMCSTAPFAFYWTVSPVRRLVKANVFPFPAVRMRTTFPFLSVNSLNTRFVLFQISTRRGRNKPPPPAGLSPYPEGKRGQRQWTWLPSPPTRSTLPQQREPAAHLTSWS